MSTRCQIVAVTATGALHPVKIYKHWDGYPEDIMDVLEPFAKAFAAIRGEDPDYMLAQIVRQFAIRDARQFAESKGGDYIYDPATGFTGWGLDLEWHSDIEYVYVVKPDGSVNIIDPADPGETPADKVPSGKAVAWPETHTED